MINNAIIVTVGFILSNDYVSISRFNIKTVETRPMTLKTVFSLPYYVVPFSPRIELAKILLKSKQYGATQIENRILGTSGARAHDLCIRGTLL